MSEPRFLVLAGIDDLTLAFDVSQVREVLTDAQVAPVPLAPQHVRGLTNLRGEVLTVVDGRTLLERPPNPDVAHETHLVLMHDGLAQSLIVDEVRDVVRIDAAKPLPLPPGLAPAVRARARGLCRSADGLVLLVDAAQVQERTRNWGNSPAPSQEGR